MPKLKQIYKKLYDHFGPQHWWPGDSMFEVVIGAILTQSANWKNVEKAIANLKKAKCLNAKAILKIKKSKLKTMIKPSGYFNAKAKKLKAISKYLIENKMKCGAREELLKVYGVGPETADSILLYAFNRPSFVVDAYTIRIGQRLKLFKTSKYHEVKEFFESNLPKDVKLFNEFHALLVA